MELGLGALNCGKMTGNMWGELREDKDYFSRFVCTDLFQSQLPSLVVRTFSSWAMEGSFLMGNCVLI